MDGLLENGTPVEVKSSETLRGEHLRGLERFLDRHGSEEGILIYRGKEFKSGKIKAINLNRMLMYGLN